MGGACGRNRTACDVAEDVVVLHSFNRASVIPSASPFALKLETFLRMAQIQYEFAPGSSAGPKGKVPWITLNGETMGDSELIVHHLSKKFNKDLDSHLSEEEKAIAVAFRVMLDEHAFWGLLWWRLVKDPEKSVLKISKLPAIVNFLVPCIRMHIKKRLNVQGLGAHSDEEITEFIRIDIRALSSFLGSKPFMMGDQPSLLDCTAFGYVSQLVYASSGSPFQFLIEKECQNLIDYCDRMKSKYYQDWDLLLWKPS